MNICKLGLIIALGTCSLSAASQTQVDRTLAYHRAEIEKLKDQLEPVGTVVTSLLSEEKFLAIKGNKWVKCDGRVVAGSLYENLTGRSRVPDCQGRFLRVAGGPAAAVGATQDFATSVAGITVPAVNVNTGSGNADIRLYTETNAPNVGLWTIDQTKHGNFLRGGGSQSNYLGGGFQNGWRDVGHAHNVQIPAQNLSGGASETRPSNVVVNVFIRVN